MAVEHQVPNLSYAALQPELTIFSAGRNNRYGHPHPEVMEVFQNWSKNDVDRRMGLDYGYCKRRGYQYSSR